jgi:hypothetical protein
LASFFHFLFWTSFRYFSLAIGLIPSSFVYKYKIIVYSLVVYFYYDYLSRLIL